MFTKLRSSKEIARITITFNEVGPVPYSTHKSYGVQVQRGKFAWESNFMPTQRIVGGAKSVLCQMCSFESTLYRTTEGTTMEKPMTINVVLKDTRNTAVVVAGTVTIDVGALTSGPKDLPVKLAIGNVVVDSRLKMVVELGDQQRRASMAQGDTGSMGSSGASGSETAIKAYRPQGPIAPPSQRAAPPVPALPIPSTSTGRANVAEVDEQVQRFQQLNQEFQALPQQKQQLFSTKRDFVARKLNGGTVTSSDLERVIRYMDEIIEGCDIVLDAPRASVKSKSKTAGSSATSTIPMYSQMVSQAVPPVQVQAPASRRDRPTIYKDPAKQKTKDPSKMTDVDYAAIFAQFPKTPLPKVGKDGKPLKVRYDAFDSETEDNDNYEHRTPSMMPTKNSERLRGELGESDLSSALNMEDDDDDDEDDDVSISDDEPESIPQRGPKPSYHMGARPQARGSGPPQQRPAAEFLASRRARPNSAKNTPACEACVVS